MTNNRINFLVSIE